jgi:hypothetical protein
MKMESERAAFRDALNMASTGRLKNVDDERKEHLAKLIRENVRPKEPRGAFDVVALLASLDAERLKLIADILSAMRPFAPAQPDDFVAQYLSLKQRVPDAILFFRRGDFYEMFFEDAGIGSRLLDIQLISRKRDGVPMCGVPFSLAEPCIAKLLKAGHKVAICEQGTPDPKTPNLMSWRIVREIAPDRATEKSKTSPPRRRRRRKRPTKPNNVIALVRQPTMEAAGAQDGGPKAS